MSTSTAQGSARCDGLDALRGLFLVLMTLTHMPTVLSSRMGQPFGFVSAAEGFVLLSAFLAGRVYLGRGMRQGAVSMTRALWARAGKVYQHHLALLAFGASVVLAIGVVRGEGAIISLFQEVLRDPLTAAFAAMTLVYQPALFDILPMYIMFLLFTPWVLGHAQRWGWTLPLALSVLIWLGAQLGLRSEFNEAFAAFTGLRPQLHGSGAFNPFAWQLLWMVGLWLGTAQVQGAASRMQASSRSLALLAVLALAFLVWRHTAGQAPFTWAGQDSPLLDPLLDKWSLGPLRLLNLFALTVLVAAVPPALVQRLSFAPLLQLGRASLAVFSAHLVCCLIAITVYGPFESRVGASPDLDLWLLISCFATLQITAAISQGQLWSPVSTRSAPLGAAVVEARVLRPPRL